MKSGERRAPNPVQSHFFRACLLDGAAGSDALAAWLAEIGDPLAGLRRSDCVDKNLFALLHHARANDAEIPLALVSVLRAVTAHEQLRAEAFAIAAAEGLERLRSAGIDPLVVGGTALAYTAYPAPSLRHCAAVDLVVAEPAKARDALGFECIADAGSIRVQHPSGTRFSLHQRLYRERWRQAPADLAGHGVWVEIGGQRARVAAPADLLVAACATSFACTELELRFHADAWFLLAGGVDWNRVRAHAVGAHVAVAAATILRELETITGLASPAGVLESLDRARPREAAVGLAVSGLRVARRLRVRAERARTARRRRARGR